MKVLWFAIIPEHRQGPSGPPGNNTNDQDTWLMELQLKNASPARSASL